LTFTKKPRRLLSDGLPHFLRSTPLTATERRLFLTNSAFTPFAAKREKSGGKNSVSDYPLMESSDSGFIHAFWKICAWKSSAAF